MENMSIYKPHPLIFLPTNDKSVIQKWGAWMFDCTDGIYSNREPKCINQHMYILSDDEIHERDWYIWLNNNQICQAEGMIMTLNNHIKNGHIKKIIATTDTSLTIEEIVDGGMWSGYMHGKPVTQYNFLPRIPTSFIKYFCDQYNSKRNIITSVNVEYGYTIDKSMGHFHQQRNYFLKVNSDHTINIQPAKKKNVSRNDIKKLVVKLTSLSKSAKIEILESVESFDTWIDQNL